MTAIPLGPELLQGSSFLPARSASSINACLFEIAPGGGYRVSPRCPGRSASTLPHSQPTRPADSSLWPYSSPHGGRALPVTLPCGARTFLYARHGQVALSGLFRAQRLPGQLHCGFYHVDTRRPGVITRINTLLAHALPPANRANGDHARPVHRDGSGYSADNRHWALARRNRRR